MLNTGVKQLRLLGIDMQARWRRRVAVVVTYGVFGAGVFGLQMKEWSGLGIHTGQCGGCLFLVAFTGVFRNGGLVKTFDVPKRRTPETMMVGSLDEWARYRYGTAGFEDSSAEQQEELLKNYRIGTYVMPIIKSREARPWLPDEREVAQRDWASRRTLVWLMAYAIYLAGMYSTHLERPTTAGDIVALLLTVGVQALTLPKAMLLWEEPDPREVASEIQLIAEAPKIPS
ncbi:hypothetical protein RBB79_17925 [Tunturiibacter empetritectus]|uniref:Uncharacterized protein n=1 Tax=Tunturiibacter lichenicola TaxID=2051959 RepID=A0A852VIK9_9BACT|nr:hypothetical protein [Edaphobacter lichenicola]NYF91527.1 hypothetical protein [Edaphobacter lichenicola]